MFVGISKTAIPGINTVSIAIFAALIPAKESTGALLLLLIVGDVFAHQLPSRRQHLSTAETYSISARRVGARRSWLAPDGWVRIVIGAILLMVMNTLFEMARKRTSSHTAVEVFRVRLRVARRVYHDGRKCRRAGHVNVFSGVAFHSS